MKKFHQMGGFSTSDHSRAKLQSVHLQYNALADHTDAVLNDRTRSKGEKAPMLAKAKTQIQSLLNKWKMQEPKRKAARIQSWSAYRTRSTL